MLFVGPGQAFDAVCGPMGLAPGMNALDGLSARCDVWIHTAVTLLLPKGLPTSFVVPPGEHEHSHRYPGEPKIR